MSKAPTAFEISQCRTIESLQKTLDQTYRQLLEAAKADWQRLFCDRDPSDASVTVRVSNQQIAEELTGTPRAGYGRPRSKPPKGTARTNPG